MSEKQETVLEQFGPRRLYPHSRLFAEDNGVVKSARCARRPEPVVPEGCCEFVRALVDATCEGRYCADGTFCPSRVYADEKVWLGCLVRLEKLRAQEEREKEQT